jgi:hypothetical protein
MDGPARNGKGLTRQSINNLEYFRGEACNGEDTHGFGDVWRGEAWD